MASSLSSTAAAAAAAHGSFARRATGLVREVRVRDAVIFNVLPACPGLIMAVSIFFIITAFAQVNLFVCLGVAAVCAFFVNGAFGLLSQAMPRSGGDYVLISRTLHPALAIGSSLLLGASSLLALGYWGVFTAKVCVGPMLTMLGVAADAKWLRDAGTEVIRPGWSMAIGFVEVALLAAVMIRSTRTMMRLQFVLFVLGMAGFVVAGLALLFTSHGTFVSEYNDYAKPFTGHADSYNYFIAKARSGGTDLRGGTNWSNTLVAAGGIIVFSVFGWYSANLAGEIRQAGTRKNWYSMLGGMAITFGSIAIMIALLYHTVGREFLTAVNGVAGDPKVYTLPNQPWWITLVAAARSNVVLVAFLGVTFVCWAPLIVYTQMIQPVRALFAWSFDGVIPERLAKVDERTHTPVAALVAITVVGIPFLYLAAYSESFFKYIALSSIVAFPVFIMVGVCAVVFPFRRRASYEASVSRISVLGVPLVSIFGVGTVVVGFYGLWLFLAHTEFALPGAGKPILKQLFTGPSDGGLALCAILLILGAAIYFSGAAWRRSQGIDLSLNYREIPPE